MLQPLRCAPGTVLISGMEQHKRLSDCGVPGGAFVERLLFHCPWFRSARGGAKEKDFVDYFETTTTPISETPVGNINHISVLLFLPVEPSANRKSPEFPLSTCANPGVPGIASTIELETTEQEESLANVCERSWENSLTGTLSPVGMTAILILSGSGECSRTTLCNLIDRSRASQFIQDLALFRKVLECFVR